MKKLPLFLKRWQYDLRVVWLNFLTRLTGFTVIARHPGYRGRIWSKKALAEQLDYFKAYPKNREIIVASANLDRHGNVWAVYAPGRHHNCIALMNERGVDRASISNLHYQGFLTNTNRWISREEARALAIANGQANKAEVDARNSRHIFSEELWDTPKRLHYRERP